MKPIRIYSREAPDWFTPYKIDLDIKEPYNIHLWFAVYMLQLFSFILFFRRKKTGGFNTIGSTLR